jgi:cell fate regulator YaaT (PSP1 superfamily)
MIETYLVRYGVVPEVAKCRSELSEPLARGEQVVVGTHRGEQLGTVLERVRSASPVETESAVLRRSTAEDVAAAESHRDRAHVEFPKWQARIAEWNLSLELLDLEWTLDGAKQILYVLTERGPESTQLALQAAAAGLGLIEVQPVTADGLAPVNAGGGCGTGGCGCSH